MFTVAFLVISKIGSNLNTYNRWRNTPIVVDPYNEILLSNKKEWTIDTCKNTDKSQNNYAKWKKPGQKKSTYNIIPS